MALTGSGAGCRQRRDPDGSAPKALRLVIAALLGGREERVQIAARPVQPKTVALQGETNGQTARSPTFMAGRAGLGICVHGSLVWQDVVDGSEGEHDQREGCVCGVKSVGAVDDEPHAPVQSFVSGVVDAQAYRGDFAHSLLPDGAGHGQEGREVAAGCLGADPIKQRT